ncbi:MAG: bifunctional 5,10-methylenetetrahydrofolate dehydrogenase/5,10-methenyltetrahydrofolate cyclohydrolase [Planctomycetes bacterium]|nr:bifunctional 5,10-methylenetetrahydrofolate dehydrogenase/5,10-methenyltetrahydrofolate cyclohydrolase [Planctomycetota bacterium]
MDSQILEGKSAAAALRVSVQAEVARLGLQPRLVVFAPEDDEASQHYVRMITRSAAQCGVSVELRAFDVRAPIETLRSAVAQAAKEPGVNAIQIQKPLPKGASASLILEGSEARDVEGLSPQHVGLLHAGRPCFVPCTALATWRLLQWHGIPLEGRRAVVIGRSDIVGAPLAALLQQSGATVSVVHTRTRNPGAEVARAEIVVSAAGQRDICRPEDISVGAVLADVGHHTLADGSVSGDFSAAHQARSSAYTPVPGGVGPLTTMCLIESVVRAAALQAGQGTVLADPRRPCRP